MYRVDLLAELSELPGKTMGNAGAIISGGGTAKEKIEALEGAGSPEDVAEKKKMI